MEFLPQLGTALWSLKGMYDQHGVNKNEIKRLQDFIQDYEDLVARFKKCVVSGTSIGDVKKLETVIIEASKTLKEWSADKSFFRVAKAAERMQELDRLQTNVMNSLQKTLGLVNMAMLLRLGAGQEELIAMHKNFLEEIRHRAQPGQLTADQVSSTMHLKSKKICLEGLSRTFSRFKHPEIHQASCVA